jgi:glycosyltransferase involved in cell wall biosynthesis
MKVAIIAQFPLCALENESGGRGAGQASTWLPQLAMAWENQYACEIHWCVLDRATGKKMATSRWNQTFHRLPTSSISAGIILGRMPQRLAFRRVLREIRPDIIHCWGTESLHGAALCEFDGPSILSMQGIIHACSKTGDLNGWRWKLLKHWESVSMRLASIVTSESQWGLDRVGELVPKKPTRKIEYGVSPSFYEIKWEPLENRPRILFAGGLTRLKGADILIEMLRRHPRRSWKLAFAGDGYLKQRILDLGDPDVEILGLLKTNELQMQMARAWALVVPSRADTSPNVVKEARVIGLPVVASPNGGHAEYVDSGTDGWIVASEDPDAWFDALEKVCFNYQKSCEMGLLRHEFFRDHFRPEKTAESFLSLYQSV